MPDAPRVMHYTSLAVELALCLQDSVGSSRDARSRTRFWVLGLKASGFNCGFQVLGFKGLRVYGLGSPRRFSFH